MLPALLIAIVYGWTLYQWTIDHRGVRCRLPAGASKSVKKLPQFEEGFEEGYVLVPYITRACVACCAKYATVKMH